MHDRVHCTIVKVGEYLYYPTFYVARDSARTLLLLLLFARGPARVPYLLWQDSLGQMWLNSEKGL